MNATKIEKIADEIALSGQHTLIIGPAGSGKTLIARKVIEFMERMTEKEDSDCYKISKQVGISRNGIFTRPFRAPHHTISAAGMVGTRPNHLCIPHYGEVTLAHNGILFLDELPEFQKLILDLVAFAARDEYVTHGTETGNVEYPARFQLIGAMNPCPCGRGVGGPDRCLCTSDSVKRYKNRIKPIEHTLKKRIDLRRI